MSEPLPFRLRFTIALRESDLSSMAKLVGFVVVSYMNDEGEAWPTLPTIAAGGSIGRRTVVNALDELAPFVRRVSSPKGNRYFPHLTPETERLVDEFLDRARRRRGQLPLPLDGRGLALAGSAGDALRSAPDALRSAGGALHGAGDAPEVFSEVVSEVESEIGTAEPARKNEQDDLSNPLVALVSDLADADDFTLHVFQRRFAGVSDWAIEKAHDDLRRRRKNQSRGPLISESRYAFDALLRRQGEAA